ncbi:MAG TPA: response regulator [Stellaceae bacterium]|nr:response regulator [Stellaceae bacterium]
MYPEGQEILVVVDDRDLRARTAQILRDEGFTVTAAAEGLAALRHAATRRFALIVAARELPGSLDGGTTVRQARTRQPWLKALYLDLGERDARRGRGNPDSEDFIAVPFERHELIGCTFELLQRGANGGADLARRMRLELHAS